MSQETPGIGGVPGVAKGTTRAPRAWSNLMRAMNRTVPQNLARSRDARRRMLRGKR